MQKYYSRLKDLREDHDFTQQMVADKIGITQRKYSYVETGTQQLGTSQQHYGKYESGKIIIPFDRVIALAEFYNVSIDYIAGYTNEPRQLIKKNKK